MKNQNQLDQSREKIMEGSLPYKFYKIPDPQTASTNARQFRSRLTKKRKRDWTPLPDPILLPLSASAKCLVADFQECLPTNPDEIEEFFGDELWKCRIFLGSGEDEEAKNRSLACQTLLATQPNSFATRSRLLFRGIERDTGMKTARKAINVSQRLVYEWNEQRDPLALSRALLDEADIHRIISQNPSDKHFQKSLSLTQGAWNILTGLLAKKRRLDPKSVQLAKKLMFAAARGKFRLIVFNAGAYDSHEAESTYEFMQALAKELEDKFILLQLRIDESNYFNLREEYDRAEEALLRIDEVREQVGAISPYTQLSIYRAKIEFYLNKGNIEAATKIMWQFLPLWQKYPVKYHLKIFLRWQAYKREPIPSDLKLMWEKPYREPYNLSMLQMFYTDSGRELMGL
jgi:hypothetical protein